MIPILPELANAMIEERLRQAQMRYVANATTSRSRPIEIAGMKVLERLSELTRPSAPMMESDLP